VDEAFLLVQRRIENTVTAVTSKQESGNYI